MQRFTPHPAEVTIPDLFPSFQPGQQPTQLQAEVLALSLEIGVPYPAEPNPRYSNWWRALHEVAHWAVKPEWYNLPQFGTANIAQYQGRPAPEVTALHPGIPRDAVQYYAAGNDVIPNVGLRHSVDPTPSERSVRAWSIAAMIAKEWEHPFRTILRERIPPQEMISRGDDGWHKEATAQVWAPTTLIYPGAIQRLGRFGVNPLVETYRPLDDGFRPPFESATTRQEVAANHEAIRAQYAYEPASRPVVFDHLLLEENYWNIYTGWKNFTDERTPGEVYDDMLTEFDEIHVACAAIYAEHMSGVPAPRTV